MGYPIRKWNDVLSIISGKNQKVVADSSGQYPIYGSGGIMGYANNYLCEAGTTIIGRKGTINRPIFVNERFWNVDTAFGVFPGEMLHPKFLFYFCQSFNFKALDKSTTIPSLAKRDLLNIEMPVPSFPEQEHIISRIEELFSQLDASVAELKTAKERLKVYRQAVLKEAFEGTLTGSEKIGMAPLGNYVEKPRYGTSKKCGYTQTEKSVEVYRIPNIDYATGQISHQDIKYSEFSDDELAQITLKCGDILIVRSNGSVSLVGRAALIREIDIKGTFAGYLMRLRLKDKSSLVPAFLLYFLQSHEARIYIENKAK